MNKLYTAILTVILVFAIGIFIRPTAELGGGGSSVIVDTPPSTTIRDQALIILETDAEKDHLVLQTADGSTEEAHYQSEDLVSLSIGDLVKIDGERDHASRRIQIATLKNESEQSLYITSPMQGSVVTSPLIAFGFAKDLDGSVDWEIRNEDGVVLAEGASLIFAPNPNGFGSFRIDIVLPSLGSEAFTLTVFAGGDSIAVPLSLLTDEEITFDIYLGNRVENTRGLCGLVYPVERSIASTSAIGRAAMEVLLAGPTGEERIQGYTTNLSRSLDIRSVRIEGGRAIVDFGSSLNNVPRGCQRENVQEQIFETLIQFNDIFDVEILVEGQKWE